MPVAREPNPAADAAREVAQRRGALWLDATELFASSPAPAELYYAFDSHLDPAGHAAIADAVVRELAPRVRAAAH